MTETCRLTPHGPGFSFIDEIVEIRDGNFIHARKWLDPELVFFRDHFPTQPLMPGVLLIECAAQAAGALWGSIHKHAEPKRYALAQVLQFKLQQPALPGETLEIEVSLEKDFGALAQFAAQLKVDEKPVAQGKLVLSQAQ